MVFVMAGTLESDTSHIQCLVVMGKIVLFLLLLQFCLLKNVTEQFYLVEYEILSVFVNYEFD